MDEQTAMAYLHSLYEGDNSTPTSTDTEYLTRRNYLNEAIGIWKKEELWNELFSVSAGATGATLTTTSGTSAYALPTNFKFPSGYVWIGTTSYQLVPPQDITLVPSTDTTSTYYYVSGNKNAGFKINLHPTPSTTGDTITYQYYKEATSLSATTTVFEMSDPWFAIYYALSRLFANDGKIAESRQAYMEASARLDRMKELNQQPGFYQENAIKDSAFARNISGFGK